VSKLELGCAFALCVGAVACGGSDKGTGGDKDSGVQPVDAAMDVQTPMDSAPADASGKLSAIGTVFIIIFENHNWAQISGNASAPYMNSLVTMGAYAQEYYNPPLTHPSLPNYLWIHAGDNVGIIDDNEPPFHSSSTTDHLVDYLEKANITWKAYEEDIDGKSCPISESATYAPKHDPFVYFSDINDNLNPVAPRCLAHVRPYSELAADLASGSIARYNFVTPNLCHDMHDCAVSAGDAWLMANLPPILATSAYKNNGAVFVTWDEGEDGDGPIGMIALSPLAKPGYSNTIHYDHSSLLKTLQGIFGVGPLLRHAADPGTSDLSDLFTLPAQ
jgi:phospholipase C